ncbi:M56 family metallopeptidase [Scrofimicrobium canadense]|nr:M56 family metallopeptidase [Scrofimicrobium canadense]
MGSTVADLAFWALAMAALTTLLHGVTRALNGRYKGNVLSLCWTVVALAWLIPVRPQSFPVLSRVVGVQVGATDSGVSSATTSSARVAGAAAPADTPAAWGHWVALVLGIWLLGVIVSLLRMMVQHWTLKARVERAPSLPVTEALLSLLRVECGRMNLRRLPTVLVLPGLSSPAIMGIVRPTLLMPEDVAFHSRFIVRHELEHLRRRDTTTRLLLGVARALQWWNPLMHLSVRNSLDAAEVACDQGALADADKAQRCDYAQLLLRASMGSVAGRSARLQAEPSLLARRGALAGRVKASVGTEKHMIGTGFLALVVVLVSMVGVPVAFAQEPSQTTPEVTSPVIVDTEAVPAPDSSVSKEAPAGSSTVDDAATRAEGEDAADSASNPTQVSEDEGLSNQQRHQYQHGNTRNPLQGNTAEGAGNAHGSRHGSHHGSS